MATTFAPQLGRSYRLAGGGWEDTTPPNSPWTQYYSNIGANLKGQLPQDVVDLIKTRAAEFGVESGLPGSQFAGYGGLRNLGLTSLSRMDLGAQQFMPTFQAQQESAMQQQRLNTAINEQIRQETAAQNARAALAYQNRGPFTPPIVGGGGPARSPSITQPSTSAMLSGISQKYGGTASGPLNFVDGSSPVQNPFAYNIGGNMGTPLYMGSGSTPQSLGVPDYGQEIPFMATDEVPTGMGQGIEWLYNDAEPVSYNLGDYYDEGY